MKYYKLIWCESSPIIGIPGFVWGSEETAFAHFDDYCKWTCGDTKKPELYEMESDDPVQFPLAFDGRMCYNPQRPHLTPLNKDELKSAWGYFSYQPPDFFGSALATEDDVRLFLRLAASLPPIKSAPNPVLDEYFIGHELVMYRR